MRYDIYRTKAGTPWVEYLLSVEAVDLAEAEDMARRIDPFDPHLERVHVEPAERVAVD